MSKVPFEQISFPYIVLGGGGGRIILIRCAATSYQPGMHILAFNDTKHNIIDIKQ